MDENLFVRYTRLVLLLYMSSIEIDSIFQGGSEGVGTSKLSPVISSSYHWIASSDGVIVQSMFQPVRPSSDPSAEREERTVNPCSNPNLFWGWL